MTTSKYLKETIRYVTIIAGCLICAIGFNIFLIPGHLLSGGISGIAFIVYYLTGAPLGLQLFIYNVPILMISYKVFGRKYAIDTVIGMSLFSIVLDATSFMTDMSVTSDTLLNALFGGILAGAGFGLIFKSGCNTGGFDVLGAVIKKYFSFDMGTGIFIFNVLIIALSAALYSIETALFSFIGIYATTELTNRVAAGFNRQKSIIIVSDHSHEIGKQIMERCERGVTFFTGHGGFTEESKDILFIVANLTQISKIKEIADEFDPAAFMIVSDTSEVMGRGFTLSKFGYKEARRKQALSEAVAPPISKK